MEWQSAERVQKNDAGQFRALIGGEWVPATRAQKSGTGEYRVMLSAPTKEGPRMTGGLEDLIPGEDRVAPPADTTPSLTTGQKIYQNIVRPVLAPTIEATGAVGGGIVGTSLGPVGTVAGAGLGYGMAKEALKLGDIYLGGMTPEQAQTQPVRNVVEGGAYELGGRVAGQALGYVGGKLADIRRIPQQRAAELVHKTLKVPKGSDLPAALNALRKAPPGASVAEATAGIENPAWQALIRDSLEGTPEGAKYLNQLRTASDAEALNALTKLAGGTTATDVRAAAEAGKAAVRGVTTPMRDAALNRANLGQEVAQLESMSAQLGDEAAAQVQEVRRLMAAGDSAQAWARLDLIKKGLPVGLTKYTYANELAEKAFGEWSNNAAAGSLDLGQGARFAQAAADSMRSVGIKPLEGAPLVQQLKAVSTNKNYAGNDIIEGALANVADDIAKWTSSGGVIDARALDAIRKNSVNAAIAKLRPGFDATAQRQSAAGVLSRIKPLIDDAIEAAGGTGYKDYLAKHTELSQKLAEKQLTGEALRLWKTSKDEFVRLVQNESPEAVEKILGPGKYNIAVELADSAMDTLRAQAQKRLTELSVSKQASEGSKALTNVLQQEMTRFHVPNWFNFWAAAGNKSLTALESAVGKKTMHMLAEAMQDPTKAAKLLETLPGNERVRVLKLISDPTSWSTPARAAAIGTGITVKNALAPENQNAMSR